MAVNTINQLIDLLNQVDVDGTVLAAIANDSELSVANGPSAGLVTTRLGTNVKNVQKVIADIENGIASSIRPDIQEEGTTIVTGASTLNFVGANITVTDVSGVATITVTAGGGGGDVSKVGTPANNQLGVWTGDGTIEGVTGLTWDGALFTVTGNLTVTGTVIGVVSASGTPVNNQIGVWTDADTLEGDASLTWDGTTLAVTGAITSTGRMIGLNTRSKEYVYIFVNGGTGVANPVDPEGAGDPFDTIENALTYAETTYVGIHNLELEVEAGTYTTVGELVAPVNSRSFTVYGAGIGTTILNFDRVVTGNNQFVNFYNMTVNTGLAGLVPEGNTQVGIFYLDTVAWNTTGRLFFGGGSDVQWGYSGSVIQNSTITVTWANAFTRPIIYCSGNLRFIGNVNINITNSTTNNGTNGDDIIRVDGGIVSAEDGATLNIQDELASTPVAGRINLVYGTAYSEGTGVTITNGTFIKTDASGVVRKDLRPEILSITASRALLITDAADILEINTSGGAVDITIPLNATVAFPIGTIINFTLVDITAAATITGVGGVTLNGVSGGSGAFDGVLYDSVSVYKRATDEWIVIGNIGTVA